MILTVDIGNSNIVAGGMDPQKTYFVERLSANLYMTSLEYAEPQPTACLDVN